MSRPTLLVLQDDPAQLCATLERRFAPDYRIAPTNSCAAAQAIAQQEEIALVLADHRVGGQPTLPLLRQLRGHDEHVRRCLLVPLFGDRRIPEEGGAAIAVDALDDLLMVPWGHPDVGLYPVIGDLLAQWRRDVDPRGGQPVFVHIYADRRSARAHEILDLLGRNRVPADLCDLADPSGADLFDPADGFELAVRLPSGDVLYDPDNVSLATSLGALTSPSRDRIDVAIVGGGPAGLSAAVYSGSEGLTTTLFEAAAVGGQAGTSSHIRNYLGFPHGLTGTELAARAGEQAWLFGVEIVLTNGVSGLRPHPDGWRLGLDDGREVVASSVVLATGVDYRRLDIPGIDRLLGAGVFYGAATAEARAMTGRQVHVVGGGNSAGQAAVHLARYAAKVTLLVRGDALSDTMSSYLVQQLRRTANIELSTRTTVGEVHGDRELERLTLHTDGGVREVGTDGLFVMIGARPRTRWLPATLSRDPSGFIRTGDRFTTTAARSPLPFETSLPGVFAVGDVRAGSVKRVAAAVGEGSVCIAQLHTYLASHQRGVARTPSSAQPMAPR